MEESKNQCRILIVDDEPDICEALNLALVLEGFHVAVAHDRDSALTLMDSEFPDAILLDFRMPGLDAHEFITRVRAKNPVTGIVLMTAGRDIFERADELGLQHYLAKPFELEVLLQVVSRATAACTR